MIIYYPVFKCDNNYDIYYSYDDIFDFGQEAEEAEEDKDREYWSAKDYVIIDRYVELLLKGILADD